ncbi:MAG: hypothetical protein JNL07_01150 [Rhodospirillales bacterium]|nr:hypothetical protein [Rhodospirillales bacterium]
MPADNAFLARRPAAKQSSLIKIPGIDELIKRFMERGATAIWSFVDKTAFADDLRAIARNPHFINQGDHTPSCGPAAFLFSLIQADPEAYVRFAIALYEKGEATIGTLEIKPKRHLFKVAPPPDVSPADWVTMASIRNSENAFFRFASMDDNVAASVAKGFLRTTIRTVLALDDNIAGITMPREVSRWFRRTGFREVVERTSVLRDRSWNDALDASRLLQQGHQVVLFINAKMIQGDATKGSLIPNHWVGLTSPIAQGPNETVRFTIFTWGDGARAVPSGTGRLAKKDFLNHFYGFIAAKL